MSLCKVGLFFNYPKNTTLNFMLFFGFIHFCFRFREFAVSLKSALSGRTWFEWFFSRFVTFFFKHFAVFNLQHGRKPKADMVLECGKSSKNTVIFVEWLTPASSFFYVGNSRFYYFPEFFFMSDEPHCLNSQCKNQRLLHYNFSFIVPPPSFDPGAHECMQNLLACRWQQAGSVGGWPCSGSCDLL